MANDIVQQLVRGSRNIDRMKAEIWMIVRMILGLVTPTESTQYRFKNNYGLWIVWILPGDGPRHEVEFWAPIQSELKVSTVVFSTARYPHQQGWSSSSIKHIDVAYDNLHVFVEGMLREFPELEQEIAPILGASSKFPSAQ